MYEHLGMVLIMASNNDPEWVFTPFLEIEIISGVINNGMGTGKKVMGFL